MFTLDKIEDKITVQVTATETFTLEVVPTELAFEEFSSNTETTLELIQKIQEYVKQEHNYTITATQAYDLFLAVRIAWDSHKKKLTSMLMSHFGTTDLTPSTSPEPKAPAS